MYVHIYRPMPYGILPVGRGRFKGLDWDILVEATRRTGVKFDLHFSRSYAAMIREVQIQYNI